MTKPKDRVERETFVRGSIERVFAALTDPSLFPTWGPERVEGRIAAGERPIFDFGWSGKVAVHIVALDAPSYFAYRWAQGAQDPKLMIADPLTLPNTLVEFRLEARDGGTSVRVVESGIDKLPHLVGNDQALEHMGKGWELMLGGLPRHFLFKGGDRVETELLLAAPRPRVTELLNAPARWWMGAPPVEISAADDRHVTYRWAFPDRTRVIEFALEDTAQGTRLVQSEDGFPSTFEAKRAHQNWGVILGMLEMALAT